MRRANKLLLWVLTLALVITSSFTTVAGAQSGSVTATLRIEYAEATLLTPTEYTVDGQKTLTDYGFDDIEDPGYVTPMHFLGQYAFDDYGVDADTIDTVIGQSGGNLNTILGSTGSADGQEQTYWMFTVNGKTPIKPDGINGYTLADYPVQPGDQIVVYGVWGGVWGSVNTYHTRFTQQALTCQVGQPLTVTLEGQSIYDFTAGNLSPIDGASILCDTQDANGGFALTDSGKRTDANGQATLTFDEAGTYVLSASRYNSVYGKYDIARPYATVTVTPVDADTARQVIAQDKAALTLPDEATGTLTLPESGESGRTAITWRSDKPAVISDTGKVVRPDVGQPAQTVTLEATLSLGGQSDTQRFTITVPPYPQEEAQAAADQIRAGLKTGSYSYLRVTEGTDTNILVTMQNLADAIQPGATLTLTDASKHSQIAADGAITYGDSRVKADIDINIAVAGANFPYTVSVQVPPHQKTAQELVDEDAAALSFDDIKKDNVDQDHILTDLQLSSYGDSYSTDIKWKAEPEDGAIKITGNYASVTRPNFGQLDAKVKLTATVSINAWSGAPGTAQPKQVVFDLTVPAYTKAEDEAAQQAVQDTVDWLNQQFKILDMGTQEAVDPQKITYDLQLDWGPDRDTDITWSSNNESVIKVNTLRGKVTRPAIGEADEDVILTATVENHGHTAQVHFPVRVLALTQAELDAEKAYLEAIAAALDFDVIKKNNTAADAVVENLQKVYRGYADGDGGYTFLTSNRGENGAEITWQSSSSAVNTYFYVTRPNYGDADNPVTLTATLSSIRYKGMVDDVTKEIDITIPAYSDLLKGVALDDGTVVPLTQGQTEYRLSVPANTQELAFTALRCDPTALLQATGVDNSFNDRFEVTLSDTETVVTVTATSAGHSTTYTFTFVRDRAALPDYSAQWPSYRGSADNNAVSQAQPARSGDEATLAWQRQLTGDDWEKANGAPLIVDGKIYIASGDTLYKLDQQGNTLATGKLASNVGYFSYAAYGDGMLFVPVSDGRIQALNADTLQPLWISQPLLEQQAISPVVYHKGYVYCGTFRGGSVTSTDGAYFCLKAEDEIPATGDEVKDFQWIHRSSTAGKMGYYWSGGVVVGDAILFGGDDGVVVAHNLTQDVVLDTYSAQGSIRSGLSYWDGKVYFTTKDGYLYALPYGGGTFGQAKSVAIGASTCTPVIANGRVYVGTDEEGFKILDAETLEVLYTLDLGGEIKGSAVASTGYDGVTYVYVTVNEPGKGLICIADAPAGAPYARTLFLPQGEADNYCAASPILDANGTLYFTNDAGYLFAIGNTPIHVESLNAPQQEMTLEVGARTACGITVEPKNAPDQRLSFASSDENIVKIENGELVAVAPGNASVMVTALDSGVTATIKVNVVQALQPSPGLEEGTDDAQTADEQTTTGTPQTGDSAPLMVYALCLLVAAGVIVGTLRKKIKG